MAREIEKEIRLSAPLNSPVREITLNVFRTEQVLSRMLEEALRPAELRLEEFNVLRILRGAGLEGHPRSTIEERMVHDPEHLLGIIHRLKQRGLVDGTLRLVITDDGRRLLEEVDPVFMRALEERIGPIPEAELRTAISVLERMRSASTA